MYRKKLSPEQVLQKVRHYCRYQERCVTEVRQKLYTYGLPQDKIQELLDLLADEDFLNEERFAREFAGGRFRLKQWGRIKIRYELKQKKVSPGCIEKALESIDQEAYEQVLFALARKKWGLLQKTSDTPMTRRAKLQLYLSQKGFESEQVRDAIKKTEGPDGGLP